MQGVPLGTCRAQRDGNRCTLRIVICNRYYSCTIYAYQKKMPARPRGRPRGYVSADNCPVTDPEAFVALFRLLRDHAAPQPRGGASWLAWVLRVSHVLVVRYCRAAPRAITPELCAALERAPLMMESERLGNAESHAYFFNRFLSLWERAIDHSNAFDAPRPDTSRGCLPLDTDTIPLEDVLGPVIHNLRGKGTISAKAVRALPCGKWLQCSPQEANAIIKVCKTLRDRHFLRKKVGDSVIVLLRHAS